MTQHLLAAVTVHTDGAMSTRVWPIADVDQAVAHLGEPSHRTHIPAGARHAADDAMAALRAASVVVPREG
ncbi:hypothetical protein [Micromonospora sp. NPDC023633]|uniref:hypothetical protein n=1 Tax=Micromonospora sp. NPDC023633 TaxID=3154320 RepID=UPI0034062C5C